MDRADLKELHCITPIANVASICACGILSHARARGVSHMDISMEEVQDRRASRRVPDARQGTPRRLHEYANLYICARNPMLCARQDQHGELCVLRVSTAVLDLDEVVIVDGNASSDYSNFAASPAGLAHVDHDKTFAEYWTHPNYYAFLETKRRKCAEVLVPDVVPPQYITGAYVSCSVALAACEAVPVPGHVVIDPDLFFQ